MAALNKVFLLGNLGQDPELRFTSNNTPVATFSIATTESRTDKSGEKQDITEWHRIVVWNKQAENCKKYLAKGRSVFIEGRLQTRSWEDKTGQKRYTTEIIAQTVQFIGGGQGAQREGGYRNAGTEQNSSDQNYSTPSSTASSGMSNFNDDSLLDLDEVPF